jgi:hypothetical protein
MLTLWIVPADFDDGWTLGKRMKNLMSKTPVERPLDLGKCGQVKIFARSGWWNPDSIDPAPEGTLKASAVFERQSRTSWHTWQADLTRLLTQPQS